MVYQSLQADHYLEGEIATSLHLLVEAQKRPAWPQANTPSGARGGSASTT